MPLYRAARPDPLLAPFLEACWQVTAPQAGHHAVYPDGCVDIVFSPSLGVQVVGAMTARAETEFRMGEWAVGVRFRPGGARPFLRANVSEFTDRLVPASDLWGTAGRQLQERAGNAGSPGATLDVLASWVAAMTPRDDRVSPALRSMLAAAGTIGIDVVARQAGCSTRQFRRRCIDDTGLSPKQLARVLRFRRAARLLAAASFRTGADAAAACGYYDQAHLIREFQLLTGRTPSAYLRGPRGSEADRF